MDVYDTRQVERFDPASLQKVNLFETDDFFLDCYCLTPGQRQEPHTHAGADKVYFVIEGRATVRVGEETTELEAGEIVLAPRGSRHGIANESDERLRALVMMAPVPSTDGGHDHEHVHHGPREVAIATISSSRSNEDDAAGDRIRDLVEAEGHSVVARRLVTDDVDAIRDVIRGLTDDAEAIITTGGTGLTPDDVTVEALRPMFAKELDGFGEHFRRQSVDDIDTAVIMTRATAGIVDNTPVFALPGSPGAVELGVADVILPELDHVIDLAER